MMDEEIKRRTARRKAALVLEVIQGKTSQPHECVPETQKGHDVCRSLLGNMKGMGSL